MSERNLDFDAVINRKNTDCLKYDFAKQRGLPEDVLPFWVADMDFKTSSYVIDAIKERVEHGIFGYSESGDDYFKAVAGWMKKHHNWEVKRNWLVKTPGVVCALALAVKAFTNKGDGVLIQQPVYYPFSEVINDNDRVVISNDLYLGEDNRYHIDFEDFEEKIINNNVKLFLLCNPHNPTGRVFTKEELIKLGDICVKHNVIVASDEIHSDFVFSGEHTVFAGIKKEFEDITVTCTAPSKTFNLASMLISNIFIANGNIRKAFKHQLDGAGISQLSAVGLEATKAAYIYGEEWYRAVHSYIKSNIDFVKDYVGKYMPKVKVIDGEGTYLVWLDFSKLFDVEELDRKIIYDAKLWLDSGKIFGKSGEGFERINVATSRSILKEGLDRLREYVYQ